MSVAWVGVAATVGTGLMAANSASDAADAQSEAAGQSNALQREQFNRTVELNQPAVNTGNAARDRLSYLLGLSPTGFSGTGGGAQPQQQTYDSLRNQLLSQYTSTSTPAAPGRGTGEYGGQYATVQEAIDAMGPAAARNYYGSLEAQQRQQGGMMPQQPGYGPGYWQQENGAGGDAGNRNQWVSTAGDQTQSTVDQAGLDAEIQRRLAAQEQQRQAAIQAAQSDPNYGRLAQQFQFDTYTPAEKYQAGTFSYTGEDLYKDPSYQFRLDQGQKALDRAGSAAGRLLSGRQLQAASDYNQGAASQEFQNAYGRALGTFGTNETGRFNAFQTNESNRFNAFNTNQTNRFNANQANFSNSVNPLLALSGAGQVSAQYLGNAGQQTAQLMGNTLMGNANAQGAAGIAQSNAIGNGLTGAVNGYQQVQQNQQQNQLLQQFLNRGSGVNNNPSGYSGTFQSSPMGNTYGY